MSETKGITLEMWSFKITLYNLSYNFVYFPLGLLLVWEVTYQTRGSVFHPSSKHRSRKLGCKNEAHPIFLNELWGDWKSDKTLFREFWYNIVTTPWKVLFRQHCAFLHTHQNFTLWALSNATLRSSQNGPRFQICPRKEIWKGGTSTRHIVVEKSLGMKSLFGFFGCDFHGDR